MAEQTESVAERVKREILALQIDRDDYRKGQAAVRVRLAYLHGADDALRSAAEIAHKAITKLEVEVERLRAIIATEVK